MGKEKDSGRGKMKDGRMLFEEDDKEKGKEDDGRWKVSGRF